LFLTSADCALYTYVTVHGVSTALSLPFVLTIAVSYGCLYYVLCGFCLLHELSLDMCTGCVGSGMGEYGSGGEVESSGWLELVQEHSLCMLFARLYTPVDILRVQ
jgi:hypothetical protein